MPPPKVRHAGTKSLKGPPSPRQSHSSSPQGSQPLLRSPRQQALSPDATRKELPSPRRVRLRPSRKAERSGVVSFQRWRVACLLVTTILASLTLAFFFMVHLTTYGPHTAYLCSQRWHDLVSKHLANTSATGASLPPSSSPVGKNALLGGMPFMSVGALRICSGSRIRDAVVEASSTEVGLGRLAAQSMASRDVDVEEANCTSLDVGTSTPYMPLPTYTRRRYLWVASVPEQLTKARMHLAEAVTLARLFGRTLILPRIGDSHVGAARLLPFCVYFDTDSLGEYVQWVSEDFFLQVVRRMRWQVKSRYLCVLSPGQESCNAALGSYSNPALLLSALAITQTSFYDLSSSVVVHSGFRPPRDTNAAARAEDERLLMRALSGLRPFPLLAFIQNSFFFTLNESVRAEGLNAVQYAPYLHNKVLLLADKLGGSFVCIHLRLEWQLFQLRKNPSTADFGEAMEAGLMRCAEGAVEATRKQLNQTNATRVFLASDITLAGNSNAVDLQTDSFKLNSSELTRVSAHLTKALSYFNQALSPLTWESEDPLAGSRDRGVRASLDKLMCSSALVFLQADKACGGGQSFDLEIQLLRSATGKRPDTVVTFGGHVKRKRKSNSKQKAKQG